MTYISVLALTTPGPRFWLLGRSENSQGYGRSSLGGDRQSTAGAPASCALAMSGLIGRGLDDRDNAALAQMPRDRPGTSRPRQPPGPRSSGRPRHADRCHDLLQRGCVASLPGQWGLCCSRGARLVGQEELAGLHLAELALVAACSGQLHVALCLDGVSVVERVDAVGVD